MKAHKRTQNDSNLISPTSNEDFNTVDKNNGGSSNNRSRKKIIAVQTRKDGADSDTKN